MDRRDGEPERLRALVEGRNVAEFRLSSGGEAENEVTSGRSTGGADR
jgi:hypothetical protein